MKYIATIILLVFCSFAYGQEKQKIALIFVGEEPKKGVFKSFGGQIQMATKKYVAENRTEDFRKLAEEEKTNYISQLGVKYVIFIEISEIEGEGYNLETSVQDAGTSEKVKTFVTVSKLENSEDRLAAAQAIVAGLGLSEEKPNNIVIDTRDNNEYEFVEIGGLVWMTKNMSYKIGTSWCYDEEPSNCKTHGRLYDWNAARKACPSGWHLPNSTEWKKLILTVNDNTKKANPEKDLAAAGVAYTGVLVSAVKGSAKDVKENITEFMNKTIDLSNKYVESEGAVEGNVNAGERLKSKKDNGTNDFGFSALMGGIYNANEKSFKTFGKQGDWWTASEENDKKSAHDIYMLSDSKIVKESISSKSDGYSVRCVKD